jgi:hypothetical protein
VNTSVPYLARLARQVADPAAASGQHPALRPPRRLFSGAGLMDGLRGLGDPDTLAGPGLAGDPGQYRLDAPASDTGWHYGGDNGPPRPDVVAAAPATGPWPRAEAGSEHPRPGAGEPPVAYHAARRTEPPAAGQAPAGTGHRTAARAGGPEPGLGPAPPLESSLRTDAGSLPAATRLPAAAKHADLTGDAGLLRPPGAAPAAAAGERTGPAAGVSIGTIEVTVVPRAPAPAQPPPRRPVPGGHTRQAAPRQATDAGRLQAGLRRWYGTAQG